MPKMKDRPYPRPGKTPENTPAPPRTPREEISKALSAINREMYRLEMTAMDKFDEHSAYCLRLNFRMVVERFRIIRSERLEDERYEEFERT